MDRLRIFSCKVQVCLRIKNHQAGVASNCAALEFRRYPFGVGKQLLYLSKQPLSGWYILRWQRCRFQGLDICNLAVQPHGLAPSRKPESHIIKLEQVGLEIFAEITAELDVFEAVYGVVAESGQSDSTDSSTKANRFENGPFLCSKIRVQLLIFAIQ
jgi:hypothetical protein